MFTVTVSDLKRPLVVITVQPVLMTGNSKVIQTFKWKAANTQLQGMQPWFVTKRLERLCAVDTVTACRPVLFRETKPFLSNYLLAFSQSVSPSVWWEVWEPPLLQLHIVPSPSIQHLGNHYYQIWRKPHQSSFWFYISMYAALFVNLLHKKNNRLFCLL